MATTTITITSATNPTYGGYIGFDGGSTYERFTLADAAPSVASDTVSDFKRVFAFFDLSTDPTGGATITKVELLATVSSVSGTHAVDVVGGDYTNLVQAGPPFTAEADSDIYGYCFDNSSTYSAAAATSAGALVVDLGAFAITDVGSSITNVSGLFVGVKLSNEAAAGSVVFDAAVGFGLRITYTPAGGGPGVGSVMLLGVGT